MITISKTFEWDMGHRVTNHVSECKNLHGHRYKMIVEISGSMNSVRGASNEGMIVDFADFKKSVESNVVTVMDHSFMFWENDQLMRFIADQNKTLKWNSVPFVPTAECIAQYCAEKIMNALKNDFLGIELKSLQIYETPTSMAAWRNERG